MRDYNLELDNFCYEANHIEKVFNEMKKNFQTYFESYIESRAGRIVTYETIESLRGEMNITSNHLTVDKSKYQKNLEAIKDFAIKEFNKDIEDYQELFDLDTLKEYEEDPAGFKNDFKKDCSMIRKTLNSKDKSLDQFKIKFKMCNPNYLLEVIKNIVSYLDEYPRKWEGYDYDGDYSIQDLLEDLLEQSVFDAEGYRVDGVIGGGIKSYIAHKILPQYFPHRSREAIWALWYLVDKKDFGCEQDSEFIMVLTDKVVTHQNFYYPYKLFGIYSYLIYRLLLEKYVELNVYLPENYRYVFVNDFLKFVANYHANEISDLTRNIREEWV